MKRILGIGVALLMALGVGVEDVWQVGAHSRTPDR